jgi:opacity protein-like surface antigen
MNKKLLMTTVLAVALSHVSLTQAAEKTHRSLYLGIFGGGAGVEDSRVSQSAIAYKKEGIAGEKHTYDLYVNSQGTTHTDTAAFGGLHVGYEFSEISFGQSDWGVRPAIEFEGYYLTTSQKADLSNGQVEPTVGALEHSLPAGSHSFKESLNLDIGVLLANGLFSFKTPWSDSIFPYIGGGIGAGISARRSVVSRQLTPVAEPTINHFNADDNGSRSGFAAQGKAGIRAEIIGNLSVFAEYRFLHVTESNYTFGPTFYPTVHANTSDWNNHFDSVNVHAGVFGIDYAF